MEDRTQFIQKVFAGQDVRLVKETPIQLMGGGNNFTSVLEVDGKEVYLLEEVDRVGHRTVSACWPAEEE